MFLPFIITLLLVFLRTSSLLFGLFVISITIFFVHDSLHLSAQQCYKLTCNTHLVTPTDYDCAIIVQHGQCFNVWFVFIFTDLMLFPRALVDDATLVIAILCFSNIPTRRLQGISSHLVQGSIARTRHHGSGPVQD